MFESRRPAYVASLQRPWKPWGTYGLLATVAVVYVLELMVLGASVAWFSHLFVINVDWPVRPWSLVTSTLSHGGTAHLVVNGIFLFFFGPTVERIVGLKRFLVLFFLAGAVSGVIQVHISAVLGHGDGALGASGSLMMLFGLIMALMPKETILVWGLLPMPMWAVGIGYALLDILGALNPNSDVGNFAHLSGMALGLGYGWWLKNDLKRRGLRLVQA